MVTPHAHWGMAAFPWRYTAAGERAWSVCLQSNLSPLLFLYFPLSSLLPFHHAIHRLWPLFLFSFVFLKTQNISNIWKLYYKEGVAWMYVYMRNYVKIKKKDDSSKNSINMKVQISFEESYFSRFLVLKRRWTGTVLANALPKSDFKSQPTNCRTPPTPLLPSIISLPQRASLVNGKAPSILGAPINKETSWPSDILDLSPKEECTHSGENSFHPPFFL